MRPLSQSASIVRGIILGFVLLSLVSCGTFEQPYKPSRIGSVDNPPLESPLVLQLASAQDAVTLGEPIYFTVIIRNTSDKAVWLPRNPDVLLTWIYPDGRKDNFLRETPAPQFFTQHNAVLLHPGQQMTRTITVKTYYFPLPGITEFRAVLRGVQNTNGELQPFWSGRIESNAYGVKVMKRRRRDPKISGA